MEIEQVNDRTKPDGTKTNQADLINLNNAYTSDSSTATMSTSNHNNNNLDCSNNYNHQCPICDKIFSANSNLNRHLRKIHKENVQSPYNNVKCALCEQLYSSSSIYNQHLENDHKVKIEVEQFAFANKKDFEEWKHGVESETTSQFIKSRGEKKTKNVNKTYYSCNRSGYYVSKAKTPKALKKQGSRKINGRCPASMNVTINNDSTYDVKFVKTHVGHSFELKHLDLSDKDRELIVRKLVSGVTKKDIIRQLRSSAIIEQQHQPVLNSTTASISPASSICGGETRVIQPIPASNMSTSSSTDMKNIEIISATNEIVISSTNSNGATPSPHGVKLVTATISPNINNSDCFTSTIITDSDSSILNNTTTLNINNNSQIHHTPLSRLHLATTKDIHNIINSKHLDSKLIRHNYDLNNVEAWISEMKEFNEASSVLFYKSQSELIDRFPKLREDDFMLVIMKDGQSEILKTYGERCIIIDSTHHVHCEYLQLTLVAVIDSDGKGFPVSFLFSTRTDEEVLEVFFTIMKDKVGVISTRMIIADELNDFYQAWTKVMTRSMHNLLTPWSVFDNWAKKFDLISNRDKLRKLKKFLRALLTESENDKFTRSLKQIIDDHKSDPEVSEFLKYFDEKFAKNPDLWSSCLRKTHGASNFQLWRLHDKFKAVYKEGKNSKKLCKYIARLMALFEESQLETLAKIEDNVEAKQNALLDRHKKSIKVNSIIYEVAVDPIYWLCPSESSNEVYYEVKKDISETTTTTSSSTTKSETTPTSNSNNETIKKIKVDEEEKCCELKCPSCATCRHEYKCTCLDYVVNLNMCKHIHRICSMSK